MSYIKHSSDATKKLINDLINSKTEPFDQESADFIHKLFHGNGEEEKTTESIKITPAMLGAPKPEIWININKLDEEFKKFKENRDDGSLAEDENMEVDDVGVQGTDLKTDFQNISSELQNAILRKQDASVLTAEQVEMFLKLPEVYKVSLLQNIGDYVPGLVAVCTTICEVFDQDSDRNVVSALLFNEVLLPKARKSTLDGQVLVSTCQMMMACPQAAVQTLLLPLLQTDLVQATLVINTADCDELRLATLRCWPEQILREDELEVFKNLTKNFPQDLDTISRLCEVFANSGPSLASNTSFSKILLQALKSLPPGCLTEKMKQNLTTAVSACSTVLRDILERTLNNICT